MTIPNLITMVRIILAPVFIIYLINDQFISALIVFVICGVTDGVDGMVARLFNQKSRLGTYLDPIADKTLLVAAFVVLSVRGILPSWLAVLVIARDVMISLGIFVISQYRVDLRIAPSILSKVNTCLQFVTVIAALSRERFFFHPSFYAVLYYVTAVFTISSGLHYMQYWFRVMGEGNADSRR